MIRNTTQHIVSVCFVRMCMCMRTYTIYTIIYKWRANKDEKIYAQHKANKYKRDPNEDIKRKRNETTTKLNERKKSTAKVSNGEAERIHQSQIVCVLRT